MYVVRLPGLVLFSQYEIHVYHPVYTRKLPYLDAWKRLSLYTLSPFGQDPCLAVFSAVSIRNFDYDY